jgi:hypothetical protein
VKRGINPDLVEQATAQDDEYRSEDQNRLKITNLPPIRDDGGGSATR